MIDAGELELAHFPGHGIEGAARFELKPLPYSDKSLEPVISGTTLHFHHGIHHKTYFENTNKLISGTKYAEMSLEQIIVETAGDPQNASLFNNAAQSWNHDFYWRSLAPAKTETGAQLDSAITAAFGSKDELIAKLAEAGKDQFGSGWAWLVSKGGKLSIEKTSNAETPMAKGVNCLLTVDVWEHAYYLDYQNARPKYLEAVLGKIINWDFAAENLTKEDQAVRAAAE